MNYWYLLYLLYLCGLVLFAYISYRVIERTVSFPERDWAEDMYRDFCKELYFWAVLYEADNSKHDYFKRQRGICGNFEQWLANKKLNPSKRGTLWLYADRVLMKNPYPFNEHEYDYNLEKAENNLYKNRKRLTHLQQYAFGWNKQLIKEQK